jgi:hypothetical protein
LLPVVQLFDYVFNIIFTILFDIEVYDLGQSIPSLLNIVNASKRP